MKNLFSKLQIRQKIALSFFAIILFYSLMVILTSRDLQRVDKLGEEINPALQEAQLLQDVGVELELLEKMTDNFFVADYTFFQDNSSRILIKVRNAFEYHDKEIDLQELELFNKAEDGVNKLSQEIVFLTKISEDPKNKYRVNYTILKIYDLINNLKEIQKQLLDDHNKKIREKIYQQKKLIAGLINANIILGLITTAFAVCTLVLISSAISRPVIDLLKATQKIGAGKLNTRVNVTLQDELGELAQNFNLMTENLEKITTSRDELNREIEERKRAEEDLKKTKDQLENNYSLMAESLKKITASRNELNREIEERKRAEKDLQATKDQLVQTEKLASVGKLAAGVAHEINNPLSAILGFTQMLMDSEKCQDSKEKLQIIYDSCKRCSNITNNLLEFARDPKLELTKQPFDINEVIEKSIKMTEIRIKTENISLKGDLASDLPQVFGHFQKIEQVILNLVGNSRDAINSADIEKGSISINTHLRNQKIVVTVADNGPGIPNDIVKHIFDPFFTTREVGKGTGLGLSISYGIIQEHQGEIKVVENKPGNTVFEILLPVYSPEDSELKIAQKPAKPDSGMENLFQGKKIMIIDDEPYVAEVLKVFLKDEGSSVKVLDSVMMAQEELENTIFDLIVCDVRMPVMNGMEFYYWLEEHKPEYINKIFFCSGDTMEPKLKEFLEKTRTPVLFKPFDKEKLLSRINLFLNEQFGK